MSTLADVTARDLMTRSPVTVRADDRVESAEGASGRVPPARQAVRREVWV